MGWLGEPPPKVVIHFKRQKVPLWVKNVSHQQQEYYNTQKEYYQAIADAYTAWYENWCELLSEHDSIYYHNKPEKDDFEIPLPCFIFANKNSKVRQNSDFCSLNKCIKCKNSHCQLSMISCTGFWDTSISQNLISQCNIIPLNSKLNEESQELCVIITPFGKYKYKHLYMGLKWTYHGTGPTWAWWYHIIHWWHWCLWQHMGRTSSLPW